MTGDVAVDEVVIADVVVAAGQLQLPLDHTTCSGQTQMPDWMEQTRLVSQSSFDSHRPLEIGCSMQTDSLQTNELGQFASSLHV